MILILDNYDSFTYNLYHYLLSLKCKVDVIRNDKITSKEILKRNMFVSQLMLVHIINIGCERMGGMTL